MSITYKELVEKGVLPGREIEIRVRHLVRTYYDVQKNRISIGNRVKVTEFINCPVCNVLIPKPKRRQWSGDCPRCGYEWMPRVENPKKCPRCQKWLPPWKEVKKR